MASDNDDVKDDDNDDDDDEMMMMIPIVKMLKLLKSAWVKH